MGLQLDAAALDAAFAIVWQTMPARPATGVPRDDDDKGWWAELVDRVIENVAPRTRDLDRDAFFEAAYSHFAEAGVWELYPETLEVLESLRSRVKIGVISNFDGRLRMVLEHLAISKYFDFILISSEAGADKPDALIFERAAQLAGVAPNESLHIGDDPVRDWQGAAAAGMSAFKLDRRHNSLRDVLTACAVF
jgi:putative hydrolase of the HAD superfamily